MRRLSAIALVLVLLPGLVLAKRGHGQRYGSKPGAGCYGGSSSGANGASAGGSDDCNLSGTTGSGAPTPSPGPLFPGTSAPSGAPAGGNDGTSSTGSQTVRPGTPTRPGCYGGSTAGGSATGDDDCNPSGSGTDGNLPTPEGNPGASTSGDSAPGPVPADGNTGSTVPSPSGGRPGVSPPIGCYGGSPGGSTGGVTGGSGSSTGDSTGGADGSNGGNDGCQEPLLPADKPQQPEQPDRPLQPGDVGESAAIIGDPYVRGFDRDWFEFAGEPGGTYTLLTTGDGAQLDATFAAGGLKGMATFVRSLHFWQGATDIKVLVAELNGRWQMGVSVNGVSMGMNDFITLPDGITVETTPNFRDTGRPSVAIVTPQNLKIEGKQRQPTKPAQIADPLYGEWLDTFITVLDPQQGLAQPVGGLIGETYVGPDELLGAAATGSGNAPLIAGLVHLDADTVAAAALDGMVAAQSIEGLAPAAAPSPAGSLDPVVNQVLSEALEDQLAAELTETEAAPAPAAQPEQQPEEQPAAAAPAPAA
ncbi:hypothetical protein COHA_009188 [Chlorella ohadii]|uniref:Uncharacterized protein n=1 Tax=Chlorella ohadii TaxID=2649997 RepID=A0AAD5DM79_9CHLO|nr:hypothetical protein COHA_009188 [Chlorella ohadii]